MYDSLLAYDRETLEPAPRLAKSWERNEDGTEWTFHLVDNAKWHDGKPLTAEDVKFTIDFVNEHKLGFLPEVKFIDRVEVVDLHTVRVYYEEPIATVLTDFQAFYILPKHIWGNMSGEEARAYTNPQPVGSGAFRFVRWDKKTQLILEANTEYWRERPHIDTAVFVYFAMLDSMLLSLQEGKIDVIPWEIPAIAVEGLEQAPNIEVVDADTFYYRWIAINTSDFGTQNPTLRDRQVRLALNHAIDRDLLIRLIHLGHVTPGVSIIQRAAPFWFNENLKPYVFDLDKAREILEEAGYKDRDGDGIRESTAGIKLEYTLLVLDRWPEEMRSAELIRGWWKDIGVKLNVRSADAGTIVSLNIPYYEFDMFLWGWGGAPDPNFSLSVLLTRHIGVWNDTGWSNAEYDALFDKQAHAIDLEERRKIVHRMQELVHREAAATVLYYMTTIGAYRSDLFTGFVTMTGGLLSGWNPYTLLEVHRVEE